MAKTKLNDINLLQFYIICRSYQLLVKRLRRTPSPFTNILQRVFKSIYNNDFSYTGQVQTSSLRCAKSGSFGSKLTRVKGLPVPAAEMQVVLPMFSFQMPVIL